MCRVNQVQLGKQCCTSIKKLSVKTAPVIVNWQIKK